MKRTYEVRDRADKRAIREFMKREGQFLLPMLELVEQTEVAIDEVIQVMGRATIEAVLEMSAEGVAGVKQAGRSRAEDDTVWYGRQCGVVYLSDRKVRVERPRLRRRGAGEGGEVEVPAYAAMRRPGAVADRMLEVLMAGVSTRKYGRVIGEMADTVGVSKSAVSRETVEASERVLKELMERRLDAWDLLVIYLDGIQMGSHHVLAAVGVDSDGKKHVLGVREGASENAEVTSALLEDLVERGLDPGRRRLFVINGSKALRKAIEKVFGQRHPIQRCRNHKLRNVLGHLPKDQHPQVKAAFRAAMKLDAKQGEQKLEQLARWLERDHPSASASLREGLSEMFTINRLGLPPRLRKCLGSTNLIDSTSCFHARHALERVVKRVYRIDRSPEPADGPAPRQLPSGTRLPRARVRGRLAEGGVHPAGGQRGGARQQDASTREGAERRARALSCPLLGGPHLSTEGCGEPSGQDLRRITRPESGTGSCAGQRRGTGRSEGGAGRCRGGSQGAREGAGGIACTARGDQGGERSGPRDPRLERGQDSQSSSSISR